MSERKHVKVWRAVKNAPAAFMIDEDSAFLVGSRGNFVVADDSHVGIVAEGISFNTLSENQRHGGLFIKMNDLVQMVPTTLVTPMPAQNPYPPMGLVNGIFDDVARFRGLI
jgi:hypothetical protein